MKFYEFFLVSAEHDELIAAARHYTASSLWAREMNVRAHEFTGAGGRKYTRLIADVSIARYPEKIRQLERDVQQFVYGYRAAKDEARLASAKEGTVARP